MITLRNLLTGYQGQSIGVLLDGCFASGSMTAIVGANGSGKSTLLKTLAGLLPPVQGLLSFGQAGLPRVGYLPQQAEMDRQFPLTVFDVMAIGCWPTYGLLMTVIEQLHLQGARLLSSCTTINCSSSIFASAVANARAARLGTLPPRYWRHGRNRPPR